MQAAVAPATAPRVEQLRVAVRVFEEFRVEQGHRDGGVGGDSAARARVRVTLAPGTADADGVLEIANVPLSAGPVLHVKEKKKKKKKKEERMVNGSIANDDAKETKADQQTANV